MYILHVVLLQYCTSTCIVRRIAQGLYEDNMNAGTSRNRRPRSPTSFRRRAAIAKVRRIRRSNLPRTVQVLTGPANFHSFAIVAHINLELKLPCDRSILIPDLSHEAILQTAAAEFRRFQGSTTPGPQLRLTTCILNHNHNGRNFKGGDPSFVGSRRRGRRGRRSRQCARLSLGHVGRCYDRACA